MPRSRRARASVSLALAFPMALAALGCGRPSPTLPPPPVIVVSIDTLRSDRLPVYGYSGVATPAIDRLRADSILYRHAYSHVPLTLPSHVSMFSGQLPSGHGVRDNLGYPVSASLEPWLPTLLQSRGYATGAAISTFVLRADTGFARGFDFFAGDLRRGRQATLGSVTRSGAETLRAAGDWLQRSKDAPFFFFFHLYEPHTPYTPPAPFATTYAASPYDGEVAEADRVVGLLCDELRRLGVYDRALIVVLSDHGEGLGDHGEAEHGLLLYREALQVPLLVKLPGQNRAGTTVEEAVQLTDILPTIAEVAGVKLVAGDGISLLRPPSELAGRGVYAETFYPQLHYGWQPLTSWISEGHHYIHSTAPELYDLAADPAEQRDRLADDRRRAARMRDDLAARARPLVAPEATDDATRRELAALGYLGGAGAAIGQDPAQLPTPQSRIALLPEIAAAVRQIHGGDADDAIRRFREILEANPLIVDGWSVLGAAEARRRNPAAALAAYEKAFELSRRNPDLALPIATVKLEMGLVSEAIELARWAAKAGTSDWQTLSAFARRLMARGEMAAAEELLRASGEKPETLAALAELLAVSGRAPEAVATAERATELDSNSADAHEQLALAQLTLGSWQAARVAAQTAVGLEPQRANAWNHLGVALYQVGQRAAALDAWERAVAEDETLYDTLYNLGLKSAEAGRTERARWALRRFLESAPEGRYRADFPTARRLLEQLKSPVGSSR